MEAPPFVVITPVRNEKNHFWHTVTSMASQPCRPLRWVIVDDGSTDGTAEMVAAAARNHDWITAVHRTDRGFRLPGTGVMEAFYDGYEKLPPSGWDFLVKLDGDLSFETDYFERCFREFETDPALGIGGGVVCSRLDGLLKSDGDGDPAFHVRGATKIYRRACWDEIQPLVRGPGWDGIDEIKANMLGWTTRTFHDIPIVQHKPTGSADGYWYKWFKGGRGNYIAGYHPLFMLCKCARRMLRPPYGVAGAGLLAGFVTAYLKGVQQVDDKAMIRFLRSEQIKMLTLRPNLWRRPRAEIKKPN